MTTQTNPTKLTKADLIKLVAELRAENEVLRDAELRLRSRNAELRAEIEEHCDRIGDLVAENDGLRAEIDELSAELRAEPQQPAPQQPAPQPQPQRRQPRDLSVLREAAMAHGAVAKFDDAGNVVVLVRGAWVLA